MLKPPKGTSKPYTQSTYLISTSWLNQEGSYSKTNTKNKKKNDRKNYTFRARAEGGRGTNKAAKSKRPKSTSGTYTKLTY